MDEILIRKATLADLDTLLQFEQGIASFERPLDPTLRDDEYHYYDLAQLITAPDAEVVVAETGAELIGSGYAKIMEAKNYLKFSHYAHLGFMFVKPAHRGKGVNRLILDRLKNWCLEKQINEVRLEVYDNNHQAVKAYAKAGFTPNLLEMRIDLTSEAKP